MRVKLRVCHDPPNKVGIDSIHENNMQSEVNLALNRISILRNSYVQELAALRDSYGPKIQKELEYLRKLIKSL